MLNKPEFPRSNSYPEDWVMNGTMGPNPLWLTEWLCEKMELTADMRVLDLGCGKALTSRFLAAEYGVQVYAVDLWTNVHDNWRRLQQAGAHARVTPLHVEAHALPFAEGFFDAIISIDAYHYFGTDELYLHYLTRFLRPGGYFGMVVPGLVKPFPDHKVPEHLAAPQSNGKVFWEDECNVFHTVSWWQELWQGCGRIELMTADYMADGWRHWRDYELALEAAGKNLFPSDAEALAKDSGRFITFVRMIARRNESAGYNLYDPDLTNQVEAELKKS
jgi:cyclopropane fatty-acyl-phospholipid synthase-like methyltransferase